MRDEGGLQKMGGGSKTHNKGGPVFLLKQKKLPNYETCV